MAEAELSPSPPIKESPAQSVDATSSKWSVPAAPDPTASFQYSKATPAGLASATRSGPGGAASLAGKSGDSGDGETTEGQGGDSAGLEQAGGSTSVEGGGNNGAEKDEGALQSTEGSFELGKSQGTGPRTSEKRQEGPTQPSPRSSGQFAAAFRLGQQGHGGTFGQAQKIASHSPFAPRPPPTNNNDVFTSPKVSAPVPFNASIGSSPPLPSQMTPQSIPNHPQAVLHRPSRTAPAPRFPPATTSRSATTPSTQQQQQQHHTPRRSSAPLSPRSTQLQSRQQQENLRPGVAAREAPASDGAVGAGSSGKKRGPPSTTHEGGSATSRSKEAVETGGLVKGGACSRDRSPSAKKRKSNKGDKAGALTMEDIIAGIATYKTQAERREAEVTVLRTQLSDKDKSLERLQAANDTLKREAMGKVNLALSRLEGAKRELNDTSSGMRLATTKLQFEMGTLGDLKELRGELNSVKQLFDGRYFSDEGELWLERNEASRIEALRSLQTEIQQRQEVISLLRDQLATKTGEIVEARDRISLLEQGQAAQAHAILEIEQVRKESGAREAEILRKRDEAEKRLDDVLVKGREREETLEEELKAVKKGVEDQKASNSSLEATNATLVASNSRLEQEGKEHEKALESLQLRYNELETSKRDLQTSFDDYRTEARAEKEELEHDLRKWKAQVEEQKDILARQLAELSELRPLSSQVAKITLDFKLLEKKSASEASAAEELLDREKTVSRDLKSRNEALTAQLESKDEQLVEESKRLTLSKTTVASLEESLTALQAREKEIANQSVKIASQLRIAQAEVLALRQQQQHSTEGAPSGGAHHKELKGLHLQVANLSATNDLLTREKAALSEQIAKLDDTIVKLTSEKQSLVAEEGNALAEVRRLEEELAKANTARDALLQFEGEIQELKRTQAALLQKRAKDTYESCQESFAREKVKWSNEMKRANNRNEELQGKIGKLSTELAKSKNRPMIDPHVASSSPQTPVRAEQQPNAEPQVDDPMPSPAQDSGSDESSTRTLGTTLSAIDAMEGGAEDDEIQVFTVDTSPKTRSKDKEAPPQPEPAPPVPVAVAVPVSLKKERSSKSKGDEAPPTRPQRTTRRRTIEPDQREGDEDEIEDVATQEVGGAGPRGKNRPPPKATYAAKKRKDVKRE